MSTRSPPAAPSPRRDRPVNRWHRNAGVAAAGVLVYLLVTGMPLQFSAELTLGQRYISTDWILDWYGLQAPERAVQSGEVVQIGQWLFLDEQAIATMSPLAGAVGLADLIVVAGTDELLVVHRGADMPPERNGLDAAIERIGSHQGSIYLDTSQGLLVADALLINWQPPANPPAGIQWAAVGQLGEAAAAPYRRHFRARMLNAERWLQDLHSGRFFGSIGVLVIDLASVLMLVLAGTGLVLWWRYRRS